MKGSILAVCAVTCLGFGVCTRRAKAEEPLRVGVFYMGGELHPADVARLAQALEQNHMNTVVGNGAFTAETVAALRGQGIGVIASDASLAGQEGVVALLTGRGAEPADAPPPDFGALQREVASLAEKADVPVVTCLNGEAMGLYRDGEPQVFWSASEPALRCFRWYGIRRGHYGVVHRRLYAGLMSYSAVLRIAQAAAETPYWVVLPAFGHAGPDAEFSNPSPAELRCMMHLAAAYGARGILLYAFQNHDGWQCLVEPESLAATDGKLAAAAEVAGLLLRHAELLSALGHGGGDIRCPNVYVETLGKPHRESGAFYAYSISKNTDAAVSTRLQFWHEHGNVTSVRDVFSGEALDILPQDEEGYIPVPIAFEPGQGRLLLIEREARK